MICIYHSKDLDGLTSGAIVRRKYPDCKLIGWDYGEEMPDFAQFVGEDIIMIDVTFPIKIIDELRKVTKSLIIIDHHIGFYKDYLEFYPNGENRYNDLLFVYQNGIAACEIGWRYLFPNEEVPLAVKFLSMYDTWNHGEGNDWEFRILPFQYAMRLYATSVEKYPMYLFDMGPDDAGFEMNGNEYVWNMVEEGQLIIRYQTEVNKKACVGAFPMTFKGLRAICLNQANSSSTAFDSVWDEEKYDIMMPFFYNGKLYKFSIYTTKDTDCSVLAKSMGGGGHKQAAGFETKTFEEAFI